MTNQVEDPHGDFVLVATCETPTQAYLLKGMLESAGLAAHVVDANIVQANPWMTQAVGGVRVLVPASQVEAAKQAIAEFDAGAYELDTDEKTEPAQRPEQPAPVFSLDRATVLSLFLTPAFPVAIQIANSTILGQSDRRTSQWAWLIFLATVSVAGIVFMHKLSPGPFVAFRASFVLSTVTVAWYFMSGQSQSRMLIATYGIKFKRRGLFKPALIVVSVLFMVGWAMSEFA